MSPRTESESQSLHHQLAIGSPRGMIALVSFGMQVAFHSGHCRLLQVFVILLEIYNLARREDTVTQYIYSSFLMSF